MTQTTLKTISPIDNSTLLERPLNTKSDINTALTTAKKAQKSWQKTPIAEKQKILSDAIKHLLSKTDEISLELTKQMGRPISQTAGELKGMAERANHMIDIAPTALSDISPTPIKGFQRRIKRVPLGVIAIIAPWNYPFLTSINGIIPALLAGNTVILKHSKQTPLVADRYQEAFEAAGLPNGIFQKLDLTHKDTEYLIADRRVDFINFTGSVHGGHAVQQAISQKFISAGLELGGKDAAYVRKDADIKDAAANLVDGAFFNSGQSCCGIERIYIDKTIFDEFIIEYTRLTKKYRLGNPLDKDTNLGPMVNSKSADFVRKEIKTAISKGAISLINESHFPNSKKGTPYLAPHILINVNHKMSLMTEENFGPVIGIMPISSDQEAIDLINDSPYGLTASIWTKDLKKAEELAEDIETGTIFANRCDYLDPALAWTGVKNSGKGCTLSTLGFDHLTRPKSYHFKEI